jgi:hypothetical protein
MYDEKKEEQECIDIVKNMFRKINGADHMLTKVFKEELQHEHRTLQQAFWRMVVELIHQTAELPDNYFDLRNEASVLMCREIVAKVKDKMYLPLI